MNYPIFNSNFKWQRNNSPPDPKWLLPVIIALLLILLNTIIARADVVHTASWYSYQSCRREGTSGVWTASGEMFNENSLTAAMWKVRFGTRVRVTNLQNGKSVIVRINDRGPAKRLVKKGRIIDLSKGAFMAIASLKSGIIQVRVEVLNG